MKRNLRKHYFDFDFRLFLRFDKPDLSAYRKCGQEVLAKLRSLVPPGTVIERASIDEMLEEC